MKVIASVVRTVAGCFIVLAFLLLGYSPENAHGFSQRAGAAGPTSYALEAAGNQHSSQFPESDSICGTATNTNGEPLGSVVIQVWSSYPDGVIIGADTTATDGAFCVGGVNSGGTYDLRAYLTGYCSQILLDIPPTNGEPLAVALEALAHVTTTPWWADYWSIDAKFEGVPLMNGDVITAVDPDGIICGRTIISIPGQCLIHVMGDDSLTASVDEGAKLGDEIRLFLNCRCAAAVAGTWMPLTSTQFAVGFSCKESGPVAKCRNVVKDADGNCQAVLSPTEVDSGSTGNGITLALHPSGPFAKGQTQVWLIVTDAENARDSCQATITVNDVTKPAITCLSDAEYPNNPGQCGTNYGHGYEVTDNCDQSPTVTVNPPNGSFLPVGPNLITVIATDDAGNADTCKYTVTVRDVAPPNIQCLPDTIQVRVGGDLPDGCDTVRISFVITNPDGPAPHVSIAGVTLDGIPAAPASSPSITDQGSFIWPTNCQPGLWCFLIVAFDGCSADTCMLYVRVTSTPTDQEFCTFTQGYYGNNKGKFGGRTSLQIMDALITASNPLVIGRPGRSVIFANGSEACIVSRLPAGGTPTNLPAGLGDATISSTSCQTSPVALPEKNGRFRNVLLGQTITLALNVRFDGDLGSLGLCPIMVTDRGAGRIPSSVFSALTSLGLGSTVEGLLTLANRGLGGESTGGASLTDINSAVDAINTGFDECARLISCGEPDFSSLSKIAFANPVPTDFQLKQNYPNPFNAGTVISFDLKDGVEWKLTIYNIMGQEVRGFDGRGSSGLVAVAWDGTDRLGNALASGVYFYRLSAGPLVATKKMLLLR